MQVVDELELTLAGLQPRLETTAGSIRVIVVACSVPFKLAVMVAVWFDGRVPAVAMNVAELVPEDTVTAAGTVSKVLLFDNVTKVFAEAAWFTVTVQLADAPDVSVPGLQLSEVRLRGTLVLTVPPVPTTCIAPPDAELPSALVMPMLVEEVPAASVTVSTATTPFPMTFAFSPPEVSPVRKHV